MGIVLEIYGNVCFFFGNSFFGCEVIKNQERSNEFFWRNLLL